MKGLGEYRRYICNKLELNVTSRVQHLLRREILNNVVKNIPPFHLADQGNMVQDQLKTNSEHTQAAHFHTTIERVDNCIA